MLPHLFLMMCSQCCKLVLSCSGICGRLLLQPHRPPLLGLLLCCGRSGCGLLRLVHRGLALCGQLQLPVAVDLSQLGRMPLRQLLRAHLQAVDLLTQGAEFMLHFLCVPRCGCGVCGALALQLLVCLLQRR